MNEAGKAVLAFAFAFAVEFELLVFAFVVTFALRLSLRAFTFRFLLSTDSANTMNTTARPPPTMISAESPPTIHQTAFDFFRGGGAAVGPGVHCGGGAGAGGGGVGTGAVRRGAGVVTAGSGR